MIDFKLNILRILVEKWFISNDELLNKKLFITEEQVAFSELDFFH